MSMLKLQDLGLSLLQSHGEDQRPLDSNTTDGFQEDLRGMFSPHTAFGFTPYN